MKEVCRLAPDMYPMFHSLYKVDPRLYVSGASGKIHVLESSQGVQQGDTLAMHAFCFGVRGAYEELQKLVTPMGGCIAAYADDLAIGVPRTHAKAVFEMVQSELAKRSLSVQPMKCKVIGFGSLETGLEIPAVSHAVMAGVPVGVQAHREELASITGSVSIELEGLKRVADLPLDGAKQCATVAMKLCSQSKLMWLLRNSRPSQEEKERMRTTLLEGASRITGVPVERHRLLFLSQKDGGLGLMDPVETADRAFWARSVGCLTHLRVTPSVWEAQWFRRSDFGKNVSWMRSAGEIHSRLHNAFMKLEAEEIRMPVDREKDTGGARSVFARQILALPEFFSISSLNPATFTFTKLQGTVGDMLRESDERLAVLAAISNDPAYSAPKETEAALRSAGGPGNGMWLGHIPKSRLVTLRVNGVVDLLRNESFTLACQLRFGVNVPMLAQLAGHPCPHRDCRGAIIDSTGYHALNCQLSRAARITRHQAIRNVLVDLLRRHVKHEGVHTEPLLCKFGMTHPNAKARPDIMVEIRGHRYWLDVTVRSFVTATGDLARDGAAAIAAEAEKLKHYEPAFKDKGASNTLFPLALEVNGRAGPLFADALKRILRRSLSVPEALDSSSRSLYREELTQVATISSEMMAALRFALIEHNFRVIHSYAVQADKMVTARESREPGE